MKLVMQFALLGAVYYLGEFLHIVLPLPVPGTVYGLLLMFTLLQTGILKLRWVDTAADFMLSILPLLFLPGAVGLINATDYLKDSGLQIFVIALVTTASTLFVTGHVAQLTARFGAKKHAEPVKRGDDGV